MNKPLQKRASKQRRGPARPEETVPLKDYLTLRLTVVNSLLSREARKFFQEQYGLSLTQWRVMRVLSIHPGSTVKDVTDYLQIEKVLVSRAAGAMIKAGQVTQSVLPSDRRTFTLRLSAAGQKLHDRIVGRSQARQKRLRGCLTRTELEAFYRALDKIEHLVRTYGTFRDRSE